MLLADSLTPTVCCRPDNSVEGSTCLNAASASCYKPMPEAGAPLCLRVNSTLSSDYAVSKDTDEERRELGEPC